MNRAPLHSFHPIAATALPLRSWHFKRTERHSDWTAKDALGSRPATPCIVSRGKHPPHAALVQARGIETQRRVINELEVRQENTGRRSEGSGITAVSQPVLEFRQLAPFLSSLLSSGFAVMESECPRGRLQPQQLDLRDGWTKRLWGHRFECFLSGCSIGGTDSAIPFQEGRELPQHLCRMRLNAYCKELESSQV